MLDIEVAGAVAPEAKIVVYFTSNTSQGFLDAITQAVHDTVNKPSVISISWGGPESTWTAQAIEQFDQAFQAAAALGITVTVAAGDNGSSDGVDDGQAHVDFPASSPNVLACGGTRLNANLTQISSEVVWNEPNEGATGGGISDSFPLPTYQDERRRSSLGQLEQKHRPRCARRGGRRRSCDGLLGASRRRRHGNRRHERRRSVVGGLGRLFEPRPGQTRRLLEPHAVRLTAQQPESFATSQAETTAPTPRGRAGTLAPGSAQLTATSCWPLYRAERNEMRGMSCHSPSATSTQSLKPSSWAGGYETGRLEVFGSEAEIAVYVPFVGSYQRSLTFRPRVIAVVSTVMLAAAREIHDGCRS